MSGEDYLTFASEDAIISFDKFSRNEESNRNSKNKKNCDDVRKSNERSPLLRRFPSLQSARPSFRRISTSFRKLSCLKKDEDEDMPMLEVPRHKSIDIGVGLARRVSLFLFTRRTVCLHPYHPYTPVPTGSGREPGRSASVKKSFVTRTDGKTFADCELVTELIKQGFPKQQLSNWMCLIESESSRRTEVIGGPDDDGSFDYGLFQINDRYWCSAGYTPGKGCNVTCSELLTDDITTASWCAQKIYQQQGFDAWLGWKKECKGKEQHDFYC